jgi:hypothetical protein
VPLWVFLSAPGISRPLLGNVPLAAAVEGTEDHRHCMILLTLVRKGCPTLVASD